MNNTSGVNIESMLKTMREFEERKAQREKETGISDEALDTILTGRSVQNPFLPPGVKVYEKFNRRFMTVPSKDDVEKMVIVDLTEKPLEFLLEPIELPKMPSPFRVYFPPPVFRSPLLPAPPVKPAPGELATAKYFIRQAEFYLALAQKEARKKRWREDLERERNQGRSNQSSQRKRRM